MAIKLLDMRGISSWIMLGALFLGASLGVAACGGAAANTEVKPPPPPPAEEAQDEPADAENTSFLDVQADRETDILLDGKPIGKTPISGFKVTPGSHEVTFVDERGGNRTLTVSLEPNEAKTVKSDLPPPINENQPSPEDAKKKK